MFAGIDLGTTFTAAAVVDRHGRPEMINLGASSSAIPSVLLMRSDGTMATGHPALQAAGVDPTRLVKEFKRRIGDPAPIMVAGTPMAAHLLFGRLLRWVIERISEREGSAPDRIAITHPANWGDYKRDYLRQAVEHADLEVPWITLTEPEAAAIYYASRERIAVGDHVAVYDLGGGTFDAAVLKRTEDSFEIVGEPMGLENLGGIDFDEAVFDHVRTSLPDEFDALDSDDPGTLAALQRLHSECETAKIALSSEAETSIPVILPGVSASVRLTREEFEGLIRATLEDTVAALNRALRSAGVQPADLAKVLLVGGSSRIPLVAQLVGEALGRPVAVDADPKNAIALGAALAARAADDDDDAPAAVAVESPAAAPVQSAVAVGGGRRTGLIIGGVVAAVAAIATVVVLASGGGGAADTEAGTTAPTTAAPTTEPPTTPVSTTTTTSAPTTTTEPTVFASAPQPEPDSRGGETNAQPGGSGCAPGFSGSGDLPEGTWAGFVTRIDGFFVTIDMICYFDGANAIEESAGNADAESIDGVVVLDSRDFEFTARALETTPVLELVGPGEFVERTYATWAIDCARPTCAVWVSVDGFNQITLIQEQEIPVAG